MPNYTLYYFNGRGRAEILRMMFAAANVKYMDKRFEFNEWDKYRKGESSFFLNSFMYSFNGMSTRLGLYYAERIMLILRLYYILL